MPYLRNTVGGGLSHLRRSIMFPARFLTLCVLLFGFGVANSAHTQSYPTRRLALVIGNATYTSGGAPLDNPTRDADLISTKLKSLGFQVTADKNLGQTEMRNLIGGFMSSIRDGDLVVIYYAGHGVEADGRDYMLPVDVSLETPSAVKFQGIPIDILHPDKSAFGVIVVFDACRDNPFIRRVKGDVAGTHAVSPPAGDLILFSASSGDVAEDGGPAQNGEPRKNSIFAMAFDNALSIPGASISKIYQTTLREVRSESSNRQAPQRFGDLADDFVFNTSAEPARYATNVAAPVFQPRAAEPSLANTALQSPISTPKEPAAPAGLQTANAIDQRATRSLKQPTAEPVAAPAVHQTESASVGSPPTETSSHPIQMASITQSKSYALNNSDAEFSQVITDPMLVNIRRVPSSSGEFTLASLGNEALPARPALRPVAKIEIPTSFCSQVAVNKFHKENYLPANESAFANNQDAIAYMKNINNLHSEYKNVSNYAFETVVVHEAAEYKKIADRVNDITNKYTDMYDAIMKVPIKPC